MDLLLEAPDEFVAAMGAPKGGMSLVEAEAIAKALKNHSEAPKQVPGGSACNTLVGIGHLQGKARMVGRLGSDAYAEVFRAGLKKAGVEDRIKGSSDATGHVLSVVTPDTQRTMFTHLGAAAGLSPVDIKEEDIADAAMVHLEGYLLFNRPVVERVLDLARKAGAKVSLDLASFEVVGICRDLIDELFEKKWIDIVIANEDEAKAYTGLGESESLEILAQKAPLAVVKVGKDGAHLARGKERLHVGAHRVTALDTTGAGDLWAAGFLYGLNHGLSLENSAHLGSKIGSEVVQVLGAVIPDPGWQRIHEYHGELKSA
jgi:sugar/nucleoside kinase (ribokinase family)